MDLISSKSAQTQTRFLWTLLLSFMVTVGLVVLCYFFVDRPVALKMERLHLRYDPIMRLFESMPVGLGPVSLVLLAGYAMDLSFLGMKNQRWRQTSLQFGLSVVLAISVKSVTKSMFGRTWPRTWTCNNPSFIQDGVYGFHPFQSGLAYTSFPSGHSAVISAAMMTLVLRCPRQKWLWMMMVLLTEFPLLLQNFHFLGDVLAGTWVGIAVALVTHQCVCTHAVKG